MNEGGKEEDIREIGEPRRSQSTLFVVFSFIGGLIGGAVNALAVFVVIAVFMADGDKDLLALSAAIGGAMILAMADMRTVLRKLIGAEPRTRRAFLRGKVTIYGLVLLGGALGLLLMLVPMGEAFRVP